MYVLGPVVWAGEDKTGQDRRWENKIKMKIKNLMHVLMGPIPFVDKSCTVCQLAEEACCVNV